MTPVAVGNQEVEFSPGKKVRFSEEPATPYTVRAIGERFAVLTRPLTDRDRETFEYDGPETVVYTIVDSETLMRGPNNLVFNAYDYSTDQECRDSLRDLESGEIELSRRYQIPVVLTEA